MKNLEQLIKDFRENEELHKKFQETLNKLRSDETLSVIDAGIKVAHDLGYEISDEEAKKFVAHIQHRRVGSTGKTQLSDDKLVNVAGGECACSCSGTCFGYGMCYPAW